MPLEEEERDCSWRRRRENVDKAFEEDVRRGSEETVADDRRKNDVSGDVSFFHEQCLYSVITLMTFLLLFTLLFALVNFLFTP